MIDLKIDWVIMGTNGAVVVWMVGLVLMNIKIGLMDFLETAVDLVLMKNVGALNVKKIDTLTVEKIVVE